MEEYSCFNCGRDLGPELEWMKMQTERGPICYVCFNEATSDSPCEAKEMVDQSRNPTSRDTAE
jgi:hypothetical protein